MSVTPTVVVASTSGAFVQAQRDAYFDSFTRETGVEVVVRESDGTRARIRQQVEDSHADPVDLVFLAPVEAHLAEAEGLLAPLDLPDASPEAFRESSLSGTSMAAIYSALVLTWNTSALTGGAGLQVLADPAVSTPRALRATGPQGTLEMLLLSHGVPPEELYPLDLERAWAALAAIASSVVWYDNYDEGTALIAEGTVGLGLLANGRAYGARKAGQPVGYTYQGAVSFVDRWCVPRNAPHLAEAMRLLTYLSLAEPQARFGEALAYGGTNPGADSLLSADASAAVPTSPANAELLTTLDPAWWTEHGEATSRRWRELVDGYRAAGAERRS